MANLNLNDAQIENILAEVKRSGLFDQFRKECIADVDTKPAYQNLKFKVENTVSSFLAKQKWNPETNRIQLREQLRKYVIESSYIDSGIERIVEQVLSPRMPNFQTQVEELMCRYLNIERPKRKPEVLEEVKDETSLLPTDLEAVSSPESNSKVLEEGGEENDEDFESPAFEPLEGFETSVKKEDPDTRLSGLSALSSNEDLPKVEVKAEEAQESQLSVVSSCSRLSIVMPASEKDTSSPKPPEVFNITEEAQMPKFSENSNSVDCKPVKEELAYETPVFDFKKEEIEFQGTDRKSLTLDEKLKEEILESETKRNVHLEDDHDSVSHSSETKLEIVEPETSKPESAIEAKKEESEKKTESEDKKEDTEDKKEEKKVDKPREKSSSSSSNRHHRSSHKSDRDRHRRDRSRDRRRDDSGSKKSSSYSSRSDKHKKHDRQRSRSRSRDRRHDHRKDDKSRDRSRDHKRDKERKSSEHRKSLPSSHKDKDVPRKEKEPKAEPEIPSGSPLPSTSKAEVDVKAVEKEEVKPEEVLEPAPEKLPFQDLGTEPLSDDELVIDEKTVHSEEEFLGFTEEEIGAQKPAVAEKKDQKKDITLNKSLLEEDSFLGFDIKKETKAQETNAQETKTQESNTNTPETAGSSKRARKPNNRYLSEEFDVTQAEDEPAEKKRKRSADVRKTGERKSKRGASEDSTCDDESKSSKGSSKGRR